MEQWPPFFKMPVILLMLITLLNDGTLLSIGYDNVKPSHYPEKWNLPALFATSVILGSVACGSSLLILWAALDSWNPTGLFAKWGLPPMPYGKVTTIIYLKVSVRARVCVREREKREGSCCSQHTGAPALALYSSAACVRCCTMALPYLRHAPPHTHARVHTRTHAHTHTRHLHVTAQVSISDFLTLFSARTHEGPFWSAAPSPILFWAAMLALSISTILACAWPEANTDHIRTEGLARKSKYGDYTLMPLWVWIYCIVWWWIQDGLKVAGYWAMHRWNLFNINTDKITNVRGANSPSDAHHPLARHSVGLVEGKLLQAKVENAIQKVGGREACVCIVFFGGGRAQRYEWEV